MSLHSCVLITDVKSKQLFTQHEGERMLRSRLCPGRNTLIKNFFFFSPGHVRRMAISATHRWFNTFCFPWWLSASCHANCKDTDGYPKHSNSMFPLLLMFLKIPKPLSLALSLLRQFLSTAIPFSLPNDSRESTLTRSYKPTDQH